MTKVKTNPAANPAAKPKAKPKAKAKAKPKYDVVRLKALADEIADWGNADMTNLIHRLETEEGMKVKQAKDGFTQITLAGGKACAQGGVQACLSNWANKARRVVNEAA